MTDKKFYQDAADEVASGILDQSLWIKACAEMPDASHVAQQAKYIQLRAIELAIVSAKGRATEAVRKAKPIALKMIKLSIMLLVAVVALTLLINSIRIFNRISKDKEVIKTNQNNFVIPQSDDDKHRMTDAAYDAYITTAIWCNDLIVTKRRAEDSFPYLSVSNPSLEAYCVRVGPVKPIYRPPNFITPNEPMDDFDE